MGKRDSRGRIVGAGLQQILDGLRVGRTASVAISSKSPIGGDAYKAADRLRQAIDDVVEILTGNRKLFWSDFTVAIGSKASPNGDDR